MGPESVSVKCGGGDHVGGEPQNLFFAPHPNWRGKAALISRLVLALRTWICSPMARAAGSKFLNVVSVLVALAGLTRTAIQVVTLPKPAG